MINKIDFSKIPKEDLSVYELWVVATWSGNPYTDDPGSWYIEDGLYLKKESAILAASVRGVRKDQVMSLSDFISKCNRGY
jgi:hypothetical protein